MMDGMENEEFLFKMLDKIHDEMVKANAQLERIADLLQDR